MQRFIMLKMFVAALGASAAASATVSLVAPVRFAATRAQACRKRLPVAALGAGLLGLGMALGGACPGMVLAQVGAGVASARATLLGGLAGAATHAVLQPTLARVWPAYGQPNAAPTFVEQVLLKGDNGKPPAYAAVALPLAAVCFAACLGLEALVPWKGEAAAVLPIGTARLGLAHGLGAAAWPPQVGGALIGALQLPLWLLLGNTLGSSAAYVTAVACVLPDRPGCTDLACKRGPANLWQVAFVTAGIAGAALSAHASGTAGAVPGINQLKGFAGGFAMLFGARVAGGCTSGHGISGFALLSAASVVAVPAMFGGGIATAVAVRAATSLLGRRR